MTKAGIGLPKLRHLLELSLPVAKIGRDRGAASRQVFFDAVVHGPVISWYRVEPIRPNDDSETVFRDC
jgi:hypothetical protein